MGLGGLGLPGGQQGQDWRLSPRERWDHRAEKGPRTFRRKETEAINSPITFWCQTMSVCDGRDALSRVYEAPGWERKG